MSSGLGISGGYAAPAPGPVAYSNLPDGAFNSPSTQRKHAHSADMISLLPREAPEGLMSSVPERVALEAESPAKSRHAVKRNDTSAITGAEIGGLLLLGSAAAGGGVYLISRAIDHSNAKKSHAVRPALSFAR